MISLLFLLVKFDAACKQFECCNICATKHAILKITTPSIDLPQKILTVDRAVDQAKVILIEGRAISPNCC